MAITAVCECGARFDLRDEFAGQWLQCPTCQRTFVAPMAGTTIHAQPQADPAFAREKFLLRQKVVSINQKYDVSDEQNQPILFVERPSHLGQNLLAAFVGIIVAVIGIAIFCVIASVFSSGQGGNNPHPLFIVFIILGCVVGVVGGIIVGVMLSPLRHVGFYRNASKAERLMEVYQDKKFQPIVQTFTLRDRDGQVLCHFHKNIFTNIFRKQWRCLAPNGSIICLAKEDSIILSLLRRFLGPLFGILRTNFILVLPGPVEQVIGEFNRKFTLFDRYVLDMSADPTRSLDRRVALSLGVMLDTGERR